MSFEGKQLVRSTNTGAYKVAGCTVRRGLSTWVVTCGATFVGERDTFIEAETLAQGEGARVRERVAKYEAQAAERQAERQAEEASEARRVGGSVQGFDPEPLSEEEFHARIMGDPDAY